MVTINTNYAATFAANAAKQTTVDLDRAMEKLSTGKRINSERDDAAGQAITSRLSAEITGLKVASRNASDGQAMIDTAEGALQETHSLLMRMRELAVQSSNGTLTTADRGSLQAEAAQLEAEISRISDTTSWGGLNILDGTLKQIIRDYTRESGVRNLEREIFKVSRKVVKKIVNSEETTVEINEKNLSDFLGVKKFKFGELEANNKVGIVTGLAWTEFGGEILKIETVNMPGKGRMQITGKLGDVMQESVKAAKSYVRSKCLEFGVTPPLFEKKDFHIHVPEGATPKDGPSAGIAMVTSIVSSITKVPVKREIAMTGEVTITGQVLPIGGLKEKLLAAHRAGVKKVLIPKENEKDLVDVPKKVKDDIEIVPVETADEVIKIALTKELKPTEWTEVDKLTETKKDDKSQASIQ